MPVYHKGLKAMLAIGTFVLYDGGKVGRLVSRVSEGYVPDDLVLVNEFRLLRQSTINIRLDPSATHDEVVQMDTTDFVEVEAIKSVAWVFSPSQLSSDANYTIGDGVSNIFVLRYRSSLQPYETLPFPDDPGQYPSCQDSYSLQLFRDLRAVCDLASKILNRHGEYQGTFFRGTADTLIHAATVEYLIRQTSVRPQKSKRKCYRSRTDTGITKRSRVSNEKWLLLRYESEKDLDELFKIFGPGILLGIRSKRPTVGRPEKYSPNMILNVVCPVAATRTTTTRKQFRVRTTNRGIDFITNGRMLKLVIRYQRTYKGDDSGAFEHSPHIQKTISRQLIDRHRSVLAIRADGDDADDIPDHILL
jgi:hypothetical protein